MGWAAGFNAGTNMSKQWLDTYRDAERRSLIEAAQKDKPLQRYTAAQGDELRRASEAVDAQGRKLYDISIAPGSTEYQIRPISYGQGPLQGEYTPDFGSLPERAPSAVAYTPEGRGGSGLQGVAVGEGTPYYDGPQTASPRGLAVSDANYSPDLTATSTAPQDTAAYRGLNRALGEASTMAPSVTDYLGKTYEGKFTPEMQRAALVNRYADIIAQDNPVEAERLRMMVAQEQRAAEEFGLNKQLKETQIAGANRTEQQAKNLDKFNDWMSSNPNATRQDLKAAAKEFGLTIDQQFTVASRMTGLAEDDLKAFTAEVRNLVKGKDLDSLLKLYKEDPRFDDKTHFVKRMGPNGEVMLDLIDQATGKVVDTSTFKNSALATAYLSKSAVEPDMVAEWMLGIEAKTAQIDQSLASAEKDRSMGEAYSRYGGLGGDKAGGLNVKRANSLNIFIRDAQARQKEIDAQLGELANRKDPRSQELRRALADEGKKLEAQIGMAREEVQAYVGSKKSDKPSGGLQAGGTPVGATATYPGPDGKPVSIKKVKEGPDSDRSTWGPVDDKPKK